ncbi:hypothetical protein D3C80_1384650 [compost metagenome]
MTAVRELLAQGQMQLFNVLGQQFLHRVRQGLTQPAGLLRRQAYGAGRYRLDRQDQGPGLGQPGQRLGKRQALAVACAHPLHRQLRRGAGTGRRRQKHTHPTHRSTSSTGTGGTPC